MGPTYKAILFKDCLRWEGESPDASNPVHVQITVVGAAGAPMTAGNGSAMAAALQEIADRGGLPDAADASAWQREVRADRPLSGRAE